MGIIRHVEMIGKRQVIIAITPTYSGCPAMEQIHDDILSTLEAAGFQVEVRTQLAPAWTTDWLTEQAKDKLKSYGISPPNRLCSGPSSVEHPMYFLRYSKEVEKSVQCPHCSSNNTLESSRFGSTACKALYKCLDCTEPFDYFKPY